MNMTSYFRPIVRTGSPRSKNSIFLAETNYWVSEAEEIKFGKKMVKKTIRYLGNGVWFSKINGNIKRYA